MQPAELLAYIAICGDRLRQLKVTHSSNAPVADLAELLFCRAFGWHPTRNSAAAADATDDVGRRYQIKARRATAFNKSRQLSAIRNLDAHGFDELAAVLFNEDFTVKRAAIIHFDQVVKSANFLRHTNSSRFVLRDTLWEAPGVRDVTTELKEAELVLAERPLAEMLADAEEQLAKVYPASDSAWKALADAAQAYVDEADRELARICTEQRIREEFRPSLSVSWFGRGENALQGRRAELCKVAKSRAEAVAKKALARIERHSAEALVLIAKDGMETEEARAFLDAMPEIEALMPPIDVAALPKPEPRPTW